MAKKETVKKTTTPVLRDSQKSTLSTQLKIQDLACVIAEKGYGRIACKKYASEKWGMSEAQAEKYYYGALKYLRPDNPDEYREALISRNFSVLEKLLQDSIDRADTKVALDVVKVMNAMLGVGGKQVEFNEKDKDGGEKKIVISFND